jgi:CheY-like chemotaxis protein
MKNILFVDSNPVMLHVMVGLLKNQSNFLRFLPAGNVEGAIGRLSAEDIHLLITGPSLPETDAYKLALLMSDNQEIRTIIMTAICSPSFSHKIKKIPSIVHFSNVQDIGLLARRMFSELGIEFGGQLQSISIVSFLQVIELEEDSCRLLVTCKGKSGDLYFVNGKPMAAKTGELTGDEAALEILSWGKVTIDIDYTSKDVPQEITTSLMNLLLESGQLKDEKRSQTATLRRHKRYDCSLGAHYQLNDRNFQCFLRDVSLGGAYLETDRPIEVGLKLTLFLSKSIQESYTPINGTVVRKDRQGFGMRFEELTMEQKQLIRSLVLSRGSSLSTPLHSAA